MDIEKLVREAHVGTSFTFHQLYRREDLPTEPTLVHGGGAVAVAAFYNLAERLPHGSVFVIGDLSEKYLNALKEHGSKCDWRSYALPGTPAGHYAWVRSVHDNETYPTYWDQLVEAVKKTKGPVLCLGAHEKVTQELHDICKKADRLLVTIENTTASAEKFLHLASPHHFIDIEADPTKSKWLDRDDWGVVFIDHANGSSRKQTIERARTRSQIVVVHDTDNLEFGLVEALERYEHKVVFRNSRPWTTLASMKSELWAEGKPEDDKKIAEERVLAAKRAAIAELKKGMPAVEEDFPTTMETPVEVPKGKQQKSRESRP